MTDVEKDALERRIDELCMELGRSQLNCDMWHDRAEDMRNRLSVVQAKNAELRELAVSYDSALHRMCNQMQGYVDCHDCILGKNYSDDSCAIDELRKAAYAAKVELDD